MQKIKKNIALILRGLKTLMQMDAIYTVQNIFISVISPVQSYVNIYVSAMLIDSLMDGISGRNRTWGIVLFILFFNALFSLFMAWMNHMIGLRYNYFMTNEKMLRTKKTMRMKYELLESNDVHDLTVYIDSTNQNGFNLHYYNTFISRLISSISNIVYAFAVLCEFLFSGEFPAALRIIYIVGIAVVVCIKYFSEGKIQSLRFGMYDKLVKPNVICNYYTDLYENYQSGKDIRIFHLENFIHETHSKELDRIDEIFIETQTGIVKRSIVVQVAIGMLTAMLYMVAIYGCVSGIITIGSISKYVMTSTMLVGVFGDLISQTKSLLFNNKYLEKYFEFLDLPEEKAVRGVKSAAVGGGKCCSIKFENVEFKYPGTEKYVLKDVTFEITPGEKTALVGLNGSVKTTIVKLLCRLYRPCKGKILLNGTDIWSYSYNDYVKMLGVVFQDFKIFAFTLGENLSFGEPIDENRARKCLEKCGFGDRLNEFPDGLDTYLYRHYDNGGVEISGGEAQKIALARAIYNNSECIILDEPTSALDPIAEYEVYSKFQEIIDGQTAIYISHRLSSCRFCDKIIVISDGCIAEQGSHEELLRCDEGLYKALWDSQAEYYT